MQRTCTQQVAENVLRTQDSNEEEVSEESECSEAGKTSETNCSDESGSPGLVRELAKRSFKKPGCAQGRRVSRCGGKRTCTEAVATPMGTHDDRNEPAGTLRGRRRRFR